MAYLAQVQTCRMLPGQAVVDCVGGTETPYIIELANGSSATALSGTPH